MLGGRGTYLSSLEWSPRSSSRRPAAGGPGRRRGPGGWPRGLRTPGAPRWLRGASPPRRRTCPQGGLRPAPGGTGDSRRPRPGRHRGPTPAAPPSGCHYTTCGGGRRGRQGRPHTGRGASATTRSGHQRRHPLTRGTLASTRSSCGHCAVPGAAGMRARGVGAGGGGRREPAGGRRRASGRRAWAQEAKSERPLRAAADGRVTPRGPGGGAAAQAPPPDPPPHAPP